MLVFSLPVTLHTSSPSSRRSEILSVLFLFDSSQSSRQALIKIPLSPIRDNRPRRADKMNAHETTNFHRDCCCYSPDQIPDTVTEQHFATGDTRSSSLAPAKFSLKSARTIHQILIGELSPTQNIIIVHYAERITRSSGQLLADDGVVAFHHHRVAVLCRHRCLSPQSKRKLFFN